MINFKKTVLAFLLQLDTQIVSLGYFITHLLISVKSDLVITLIDASISSYGQCYYLDILGIIHLKKHRCFAQI